MVANPVTAGITEDSDDTTNTVPSISIANAELPEQNGTMTFTVNISPTPTSPASVSYNTLPGTALAGTDYQPASGVLTFSSGQTTPDYVRVPILDDKLGQLTGINHDHMGTSLDNLTSTYDPLGRVSTFTSIDGTATYGYDPISQLTGAPDNDDD